MKTPQPVLPYCKQWKGPFVVIWKAHLAKVMMLKVRVTNDWVSQERRLAISHERIVLSVKKFPDKIIYHLKKKKTLNGPSHLVSKKPCVCISSVFTGHNWQGFLGMLYLAGNFLTIVIWYVQDFSFFMIFKIFFGQCLYLDSEFLPHFLCDLPPFFFSR